MRCVSKLLSSRLTLSVEKISSGYSETLSAHLIIYFNKGTRSCFEKQSVSPASCMLSSLVAVSLYTLYDFLGDVRFCRSRTEDRQG